MNFFLILSIILPFLSSFLSHFDENENLPKNKNLISKFFAFLFLICAFANNHNFSQIEILKFSPQISLAFEISKTNVRQLFLLSFLWIILIFYSEKFLFIENKKSQNFYQFLSIFIACLNLIIISKNLVSLVLAYNLLSFIFIFLLTKFLLKQQDKKSYIFIFLLFFEIILLFLAIVLIGNFANNFNFNNNGVEISASKHQSLFIILLFFSAILFNLINFSFFLYHKNLIFDDVKNYLAFPLFLGFSKILIFAKIIKEVFSIGLFSMIFPKILSTIIIIFLGTSSLVYLAFALFSQDFKKIFFYLFFSLLSFSFLTIFFFATNDYEDIYKIVENFILSITLLFIIFSNLILYLKRAENKDFTALFYDLKITFSLLIFALFSLVGFFPSSNMLQNFHFLKLILAQNSILLLSIFILYSGALALFSYKLIFPTFLKNEIARSQNDKLLAQKIDSSSSLSLTALVIACIILLIPIIEIFYG